MIYRKISILLLLFALPVNIILASPSLSKAHKEAEYIILSVDGGGIRGIIAARILEELEKRTGKPAYKLFNLMVGTSTGGIIIMALNTPSSSNEAKYSAGELVNFYKTQGKDIFSASIARKIFTGFGLWGAKYDRKKLDSILDEMLEDTLLSNTLKPIMSLSYCIECGDAHLWTSFYAKSDPEKDYYLRDIAGATSAAPTYFSPKTLKNKLGNKLFYEADGGIYANNPAIMALAEAIRVNPSLKKSKILLLSIGTGKTQLNKSGEKLKNSGIIGWVMGANLVDVMISLNSELAEWQSSILNFDTVRIQIDLEKNLSEMDNVSEKNITTLLRITDDYIEKHSDFLEELSKKLILNSDE